MVHAKGVEAIVAGMRALRDHAMVQLSALLAFIPLALENTMLQVSVRGHTLRGLIQGRRVGPHQPLRGRYACSICTLQCEDPKQGQLRHAAWHAG